MSRNKDLSTFIVSFPFQIRGYNDGGWFTLYPNFGETANAGPPFFFQVLSYVCTVYIVLYFN